MSPRTRGWTPSFVRGDKMEMPGSGRYRGNPVDSTVSRRECERTRAYKGAIRICPFVLPPALKAMFPTLMPKKTPRFISPDDRTSERYIWTPIKSGGDWSKSFLFFGYMMFPSVRTIQICTRDAIHQLLFRHPRKKNEILSEMKYLIFYIHLNN